ncbi:putative cross-wall-targeting lipoprotein signal domain-containing proteiin, partial [Streptococcus merionis]|uniref:putative cross-wall-targeting lipoprotein signal domain-containing proteiin n=1 Tax=Streptococcus merionis TaxID=400065 RepID=UPI003511D48A
MDQKTQQGHGFFRKSKAYGLVSGIALGAMLVTGAQVSADENTTTVETTPTVVVTDNPATNLVEAQPATPEANLEMNANAGKQEGNLVANVDSTARDQAVASAEKAGVEVTKGEAVVHQELAAAEADLAKQTEAVKAAEAEKRANTQEVEAAKKENSRIQAANEAGQKEVDDWNKAESERVQAANEAGQKEIDAKNKAEKARIEAERDQIASNNAAAMAQYRAEMEQYLARVEAQNGVSVRQSIEAFLSKTDNPIRVVNPANAGGRISASTIQKLTQAELDSYATRMGREFYSDDIVLNGGDFYKVRIGDTITYSGLVSGNVDVTYTFTNFEKGPISGEDYVVVAIRN